MTFRNIAGIVARIVVGLVFVLSALTKYLSVDAVDLFVYEHRILSWDVTTFATRLLIVIEAFTGIMLLIGIYPKHIKRLAIVMLAAFTVYVLVKPFIFDVDTDNCHCFGTVLLLSDKQTLVKNIILLVISYFMFWDGGFMQIKCDNTGSVSQEEDTKQTKKKKVSGIIFKNRKFISVLLFVVLLIVAMTVKMPEPVSRRLYPKTASIDKEKFDMLIGKVSSDILSGRDTVFASLYDSASASLQDMGVMSGKKILCLYSTGCKYCKRSAIRLDVIRQRYNIADTSFALVFWGNINKVDSFFVKTDTKILPHVLVSPYVFLPATKGRQPVIALMEDGEVKQLLKYPNINEKEIADFFDIKH